MPSVKSLLTLVMLVAFVFAQGTSVAASICHHANALEHIAARQSHDSRKAAVALAEENASAVASKKGSLGDQAPSSPMTVLLPASMTAAAVLPQKALLPRVADGPPLGGLTLRPPLPPPLA